jgi:hypothetical protein
MASHDHELPIQRSLVRQWAHAVKGKLFGQTEKKSKPRPFSEFLPFQETLSGAKAARLSVGDYLERKHAVGTQTPLQLTIDGLAALGLYDRPLDRICELGPGSGRYLEKTKARCQPRSYEIYETSTEWRDWLVSQYGVEAKRCDSRHLGDTESNSVDLVHAYRLFPGLPFLITVSYFLEMARVARSGGWIVFDIMTERCFTGEHLEEWFKADPWEWAWAPHQICRDFAIGLFAGQGASLVGSFIAPHHPAVTECLVFRKGDNGK